MACPSSNTKNRERSFEQDSKTAYLEKNQDGYFRFFKQTSTFPILIINVDNIDSVNNRSHFEQFKVLVFKSHYKLRIKRLIK